jgi:hypothetical protein
MPCLEVFRASWLGRASLRSIFAGRGPSVRKLRELELSNVVLDVPLCECVDMLALRRLTLLDCIAGKELQWSDILKLENVLVGESPVSTQSSGGSFTVRNSSLDRGAPLKKELHLKALRINSVDKHWVDLLASFSGLEELYILPSTTTAIDADTTSEDFINAVIAYHSATMKNLRLSDVHTVQKKHFTKIIHSCTNLEELSLRMMQSEWVRIFHPRPFLFPCSTSH